MPDRNDPVERIATRAGRRYARLAGGFNVADNAVFQNAAAGPPIRSFGRQSTRSSKFSGFHLSKWNRFGYPHPCDALIACASKANQCEFAPLPNEFSTVLKVNIHRRFPHFMCFESLLIRLPIEGRHEKALKKVLVEPNPVSGRFGFDQENPSATTGKIWIF